MKRLVTIFAALAAFAVSPALADDAGFFFKPYVGADYQYTDVSYQDITGTAYSYGDGFANTFNGGDIHVGARVSKYLGVEGGYYDNASSTKSNILGTTASSSVRFDGWTLDALGYIPLGASQKFELIGTTGLAYTTASGSARINGTNYSIGSSSEWEWRIGAGAEYWLTDNINLRGLVRYQTADFNGIVDNAVVSSIGVNYQF